MYTFEENDIRDRVQKNPPQNSLERKILLLFHNRSSATYPPAPNIANMLS